ncbi:hypothetical protein [Streptomyces roseolus]|uniref:hypothetical protein n=1 Tax=Streptomyces roseolus TaxID=67358 RepID=UPI0037ACE6EB
MQIEGRMIRAKGGQTGGVAGLLQCAVEAGGVRGDATALGGRFEAGEAFVEGAAWGNSRVRLVFAASDDGAGVRALVEDALGKVGGQAPGVQGASGEDKERAVGSRPAVRKQVARVVGRAVCSISSTRSAWKR